MAHNFEIHKSTDFSEGPLPLFSYGNSANSSLFSISFHETTPEMRGNRQSCFAASSMGCSHVLCLVPANDDLATPVLPINQGDENDENEMSRKLFPKI